MKDIKDFVFCFRVEVAIEEAADAADTEEHAD
jgi:hypothetical protein